MKEALKYNSVKNIYDKSYWYYDIFHKLGTFNLDNRGREYLIEKTVKDGDKILDAGGGTGTTTLLALKRNKNTQSVILDFSKNMLLQSKEKAAAKKLQNRISFIEGDMYDIPFPDNYFDAVISTYSTCPLENPIKAVDEMLRVLKPSGLLGIAHSCESENKIARKISNVIESIIWRIPRLSLGCRNINLLDDIGRMNVEIVENKVIGFIPFYFKLLVLKKL